MKITKIFDKKKWIEVKDYRGDTLWKKATGQSFICDYLGDLKAEDTDIPAPSPFYHVWDKEHHTWEEDIGKKKIYLLDECDTRWDSVDAELKDDHHGAVISGKSGKEESDEWKRQYDLWQAERKAIQDGTQIPVNARIYFCKFGCGILSKVGEHLYRCDKCGHERKI